MGRFEGKVVLVAGAGSVGPGWGNGKAAAVLFAREGAHVVAADIQLEAARETKAIIDREGGSCLALQVDVTGEDSVTQLVRSVLGQYGRIDVLHNNVGIAKMKPTVDTTLEEWEEGIAVNLRGVFLTCRSVLPAMIEQGNGSIVNVSSVAAMRWVGAPCGSYSAAKAGVIQFSRTLALEHASDGVRVNSVVPGFMDTPTIRESYNDTYQGNVEAMRRTRDAACPSGHMGNAWDVAEAVVFLASDDSRYISGAELIVDGGLTSSIGFSPNPNVS